MTKILYISNYQENSGWGNCSLNNILALDSTGVDLVIRPISFGGTEKKLTNRILELQNKEINNVDVCIQHVLPNLYCYNGSYHNIGYYEAETNDYYSSMWPKYVNMMNKAWVPTELNKKQAVISGVNIPINVVNHCIEWERYQNIPKAAHINELDGSYNFCFVGELSRRKNISAILRAFHTEFHPSENVNLFFKLNCPGLDPDRALEKFEKHHSDIKSALKIRNHYKKVYVVTRYESYINLLSMMKQCHCFISSSYGEAWCQPALDSLAMGLNVLYTDETGTSEFAGYGARSVKSYKTPCYGANDTLSELYSSFDSWQEIDINALMFGMRNMYEQRNSQDRKKIAESVKYLDYKEVGQRMLEAI